MATKNKESKAARNSAPADCGGIKPEKLLPPPKKTSKSPKK